MKGLFIPEITAEMFRNGCLESIEALMAEGKIYDIEIDFQKPCNDCISRQEAINCVTLNEFRYKIVEDIKTLPSVAPKEKTGHWEPIEYDGYADGYPVWDVWECSKCGLEHNGDKESLTAFCPNCGARMVSE